MIPINKEMTPITKVMTAINKDKSGSESGSIPSVHPCNSSMPKLSGVYRRSNLDPLNKDPNDVIIQRVIPWRYRTCDCSEQISTNRSHDTISRGPR